MSTKIANPVKGQLYTVAAPSGAGKTSLVKALLESVDNLHISISYTTRAAREGEVDGVNYHFVDDAKFNTMIEHGDFLEHAQVFHHQYGTSNSWVGRQLEKGKNVILEIDWQGVQQIKQLFPECLRIFILPPSMTTLRQRLESRGKDSEAVIEDRLAVANREIAHYKEAEFLVVNDDFQHTLAQLQAIVTTKDYLSGTSSEAATQLAEQLLANQ